MDFVDFDNINGDVTEFEEESEIIGIIRAPKRYIRDGPNPFEFYSNTEFKRRFLFTKDSVLHGILPLIQDKLQKMNNHGLPVSPVFQLLVWLRFYATASFQVSTE